MKQVRKVLAPTDLSEFSKTGMRYALTLAKAVGADGIVYHAFDHQNFIDYESAIKDRKKIEGNAPDEGIAKVLPRGVKTAFDHYGEAAVARSDYAPVSSVKAPKVALSQFLQDNFSDLLSGLNVREEVELSIRDVPCPVIAIGPESVEKLQEKHAAA